MTNHLSRIREHFRVETEVLRLKGDGARILDHKGSRGTDAENSLLQWLQARLAPDFTVSSGEVIDSFSTDTGGPSRQQDGIIHRNDRNANRFMLPSGLRLVPVESVAGIIEVKLTLNSTELSKADVAATQTRVLRMRATDSPAAPLKSIFEREYGERAYRGFIDYDNGIELADPGLAANPLTFAVFGYGGIEGLDKMVNLLRTTTTINLLCCLGAGCVARRPLDGGIDAVEAPDALAMFADYITRSVVQYEAVMRYFKPSFVGYAGYQSRHFVNVPSRLDSF